MVATLGAVAYYVWSPTPAPAAPVAVPIAAVPAEQADSLAALTEESERLARSQVELTQAMQQTVAKYQAQSGGALPADGADAGAGGGTGFPPG